MRLDADKRGPDGTAIGQKLLMQGVEAMKRGETQVAESLLCRAHDAYPPQDMGRRTALVHLGMIYRRDGRLEEAMEALARALPLPAAFTELKGVLRFFAKAAKNDKDAAGEREWYGRLYSLAIIEAVLVEQRAGYTQQAEWVDSERPNLYSYPPDPQGLVRIEQAGTLSAADCKAIRGTVPQ